MGSVLLFVLNMVVWVGITHFTLRTARFPEIVQSYPYVQWLVYAAGLLPSAMIAARREAVQDGFCTQCHGTGVITQGVGDTQRPRMTATVSCPNAIHRVQDTTSMRRATVRLRRRHKLFRGVAYAAVVAGAWVTLSSTLLQHPQDHTVLFGAVLMAGLGAAAMLVGWVITFAFGILGGRYW